jgi:endoglycosylceramidase
VRRAHPLALAVVLLTVGLVAAACRPVHHPGAGLEPAASGPLAPLTATGRWFTDPLGRVATLHGVNEVAKIAPYHPAAFGFGDDDARFLAAHGMNVLRLGVDFRGVMPEPGRVDGAYIDELARTVRDAQRHRIFVLLDFHQDGFSPMFNGNGLPDWMAITDGLPNPPDAVFPLYYIQNPAMQRAFDHFWANDAAPDGVGLQDHFATGVAAVTSRFAGNPWVLGVETLNEPWPGTDWTSCLSAAGCPDLEAQLLAPFHRKVADAVHAVAPRFLVLGEPFVLFNFGQGPTDAPGIGADRTALSFHSYATDVQGEEQVVAHAVAAATRQGVPLLATEFGDGIDPVVLDRLTDEFEGASIGWLDWSYDGNVIADTTRPAGLDNLRSLDAWTALVRPYATAIAGTPTVTTFDGATTTYHLEYDTVLPDGRRAGPALPTTVHVPPLRYPDGWRATVEGARITSLPCVSPMVLRARPGASHVRVTVAPGRCLG